MTELKLICRTKIAFHLYPQFPMNANQKTELLGPATRRQQTTESFKGKPAFILGLYS